MLDNWQRIEQVIKWSGAASVSAFARDIGLNRGENLYQIKRGNNRISRDLAETITEKFPQISKAWLLTGEGDMLPTTGAKEKYDIPFFQMDVAALAEFEQWPEPSYFISFPMFKGSDLAALSFSDAMSPEITKGAIVFMQKCEPDKFTPGGIYYVESPRFNGIRYIRREAGSNKIRLTAKNIRDYDDIELSPAEITGLFRVRGVLTDKSA